MRNNSSLRQIGEHLESVKTVIILPHVSADGDAIGSSVALCKVLRQLGKESYVVLGEKLTQYLAFVPAECCTLDLQIIEKPDVAICVDCSEESRIPGRSDIFQAAATRICIDHHIVDEACGDYNYIDPTAAACAEHIYTLIQEMDWPMDKEAAKCLYTGIVTDTGSFKYSNTSKKTHIIAGELIEMGVDVNEISVELFQKVSMAQTLAEARLVNNAQFFAGNRGAIASVTNEELEEMGACSDDTEGVIDRLRDVRGVEVAAFLKEKGDGIKVSLRAKTDCDVRQIAVMFNGGGHTKAAGCTIYDDMDTAVEKIKAAIEESLEK